MDFFSTFLAVLVIIVLAIPGYILRKAKILADGATGVLAGLLLYVSQPGLMVSSILNKAFSSSMLVNFAWIIFFAVVLQLVVYFVAKLLFARCSDEPAKRACVACSYLGNVGFMGIPVMKMLFPGNDELVLYTAVYNIAFNAMVWTLGVYAVTGNRKSVNPIKILLNPPTIATILALPFFFFNVAIPQQVMTPIEYLGNMTLPLSMVILGIRLADMHPLRLLNDGKTYLVTAIKLILSPLLSFGLILLVDVIVPIDRYVMIALYVIAAMPTASSALNFAEMYGGDRETAAACTLMSTIVCILTIPILMLLCQVIQ